jgi:2-polyprenylphenol 6-hydroxylase
MTENSSMKAIPVDVSIIGGGVIGLTLAIALSQQGLKVALIDTKHADFFLKQKQIQPYDARVYAVNQAALNLFDSIGVTDSILQARHGVYHDMVVWAKGTDRSLFLTSRTETWSQLGYIVEQSILLSTLWDKLQDESRVSFFGGAIIQDMDVSSACINLQDGTVICSELIVGADGANSFVRKNCAFELTSQSYVQSAIVANVSHTAVHNNTAYQCFDRDEPLAFLPLAHAHHSSVVWSCATEQANMLLKMRSEQFVDTMREAIDAKLGDLTLISDRFVFPLMKRHAKQYFKERVVLVGDAAHTVHPMAGLGMNLGLMDVQHLVDSIARAYRKERDIGSQMVLRRYERRQLAHNAWMIKLLDTLKFSFQKQLPYEWINHLPWVKSKMINVAQGAYSLPRILT